MHSSHQDLQVYDTLSRNLRRFEPLVPGHVGIYVCGPTVYSDAHLGHAKSYVSFDVIVRYLRHLGFKVRYVQNITDVGHLTDDADEGEDKMAKRARLDRLHPMELAERYTTSYLADMDALKVKRADIYPRATQHIMEQIAIIEDLIEKGHAYEVEGNVYFSVPSWADYGELSGRQTDDQEAGHRVVVRADKRDPRDFALWKSADGGHILRWNSPWGWGYPGWHIECSAMSTKYLGEEFDIHGGGVDNKFPHHECEIAQSRAVGHPFARYWLHNNMINVDGKKMGKSLGNFINIKDALAKHKPEAIRAFLLSTHYRGPANYTDEGIESAQSGIDRIRTALSAIETRLKDAPEANGSGDTELAAAVSETDTAFHAAMNDDFNSPIALSALFELTRVVNRVRETASRQSLKSASDLLIDLGENVLGVIGEGEEQDGGVSADPFIDLLIDIRQKLKAAKSFELSDAVRDGLAERGITLKDGKDGASWSRG